MMMTDSRKVLFISAPIGAGHVRAAQAVGAAVRRLAPGTETLFVNIFDFFSPRLGRTILAAYLKILDIFPGAYGAAYGWGNTSRVALAGREAVSSFLAGKMRRYLAEQKPDAVVVTHATPAGLVAHLAARGGLPVPTFAIVTDFVVHRLWVYPEIDQYFVAADELCAYLAANGVDHSRSAAVGIPVDDRFTEPADRATVARRLELRPDLSTILVMGGGAGVLPMVEIVSACESLGRPLQVVAVTGRNASLRKKLAEQARSLRHVALIPLGFVENIHELMTVAHLLISKPGGMTAAEAMAKGVPLLVYRPIPGQEEANTRFLVARGAAVLVESPAMLSRTVAGLLAGSSEGLAAIRSAAFALGRPLAAETIAREILVRLGNYRLD